MFVFKTDLEKAVYNLINKVLLDEGYDLVKIRSSSGSDGGVIQIMFEKLSGENVGIDDCVKVTDSISDIIEVDGLLSGKYSLQVSSPGVDKPLTRIKDFTSNINKLIKLTTIFPVDGRRKFSGRLESVDVDTIKLSLDSSELICIKVDNILEANLIFEWPKQKLFNKKSKAIKKGTK